MDYLHRKYPAEPPGKPFTWDTKGEVIEMKQASVQLEPHREKTPLNK